MGLFDKKKVDDYGSPIEQIDLSTQPRVVHATAPQPSQPYEPEPVLRYGINQAIELMRTLPQDNVELVVQVVKRTLESTRIRIDTIIQDASRKQADIEGRVSVLNKEIAELDREITTRKAEIAHLQADHKETSLVKDRLVLAEKLTGPSPAPSQTSNGAQARATAPAAAAEETTPVGRAQTTVSGQVASGRSQTGIVPAAKK